MSTPRISLVWLVFIAVAAVFGALVLRECSDRTAKILFALPEGYRGVVLIKVDFGALPAPRMPDGYRVVVPEDGIVRLPSASIFHEWHLLSGIYPSGHLIPDAEQQQSMAPGLHPDAPAMWQGVDVGGGSYVIYVGTAAERQQFGTDVQSARNGWGAVTDSWRPPSYRK